MVYCRQQLHTLIEQKNEFPNIGVMVFPILLTMQTNGKRKGLHSYTKTNISKVKPLKDSFSFRNSIEKLFHCWDIEMCMSSSLGWTSVKFVIRINCKCIEVTILCCVHGLFCHRLNFELYLGCNYCITLLKTCAVFSCYLLLRIQFSTHLSKRTGLPRWQWRQITCR